MEKKRGKAEGGKVLLVSEKLVGETLHQNRF